MANYYYLSPISLSRKSFTLEKLKLYDVAIIGGGPTGSRVAHKMVEKGHRVIVVEQKEHLGSSPFKEVADDF